MNIERKYNRGAKIILFISIIAIPMQLLTSALISRISSEASGILGIIEIFYNAMITFFMLGGETAIIKLLTNKKEIQEKKNFILKYILGCITVFLIIILGTKIFQIDIIQEITGQSNKTSIIMYLVALAIIINNILLAYVKENEMFVNYAIGIKLFNVGNLLAVLYISFISKNNNIENILLISMGILQVLNIIYIIIKEKIFYNINNIRKHGNIDFKMFKYIFFLYLSMILVFVYDKIDQIIVVNKLGLSILGGYYLIVKVVNMVKLLPNTYNSTFYPYICKQLSKENANNIFNNVLSKNLMFIFPLTVLVIANSKLIITMLFGSEYLQYNIILQVLTALILFSAPNVILNNFLYAIEDSKRYFFISLISITSQVVLIYCFIDKMGLLITIIARGFSMLLTLVLCKVYMNRIGYKTKLPSIYYLYNIIVAIILLVINIFNIPNYFNIIISIMILTIFCIINRKYIMNILKIN